jgi:hypothetical protein
MRGLDLFSEKSMAHYLSIALRNKLAAILEPAGAVVSKPAVKRRQRTTAVKQAERMAA